MDCHVPWLVHMIIYAYFDMPVSGGFLKPNE